LGKLRIKFSQKQISESTIFNYLTKNQDIFIPRLDTSVNIRNYALKLHKHAVHFCAFDKDMLVGFAACYFNDGLSKTGFLSSISVSSRYQGLGVMKNLLNLIIGYGRENGFRRIRLEVRLENKSVSAIYKKYGFVGLAKNNDCLLMELELLRDSI